MRDENYSPSHDSIDASDSSKGNTHEKVKETNNRVFLEKPTYVNPDTNHSVDKESFNVPFIINLSN